MVQTDGVRDWCELEGFFTSVYGATKVDGDNAVRRFHKR